MPRYYFDIKIGDECVTDYKGDILRDADHALNIGLALIVCLLTQKETAWPITAVLIVNNDAEETIFEIPFVKAVRLLPRKH